jgi:hypothetical protein
MVLGVGNGVLDHWLSVKLALAMRQKSLHLVIYKDHRGAAVRYFGPFANETSAEFFQAAVGEPLEGGYSHVRTIQPFASFEGRTVHQLIKRERENGPQSVRA